MGLFDRKHKPDDDAASGGPDGVFELADPAGGRVRYTPDDFVEVFSTTDAREMRRHLELGWLLLDSWVGHTPGGSSSWVDTMLRRSAGRVLPAQDDPAYKPPGDVTTYVLGHLKAGAHGTPLA